MQTLPVANYEATAYSFEAVPSATYADNTKLRLRRLSNSVVKSRSKRIFDIIFSIALMVLVLSWLFPIIALLIKIGSKGPVLFVQDRVGLDGKIFKCFKFRTMKTCSVKYMYTPTEGKDPRVTKFGYLLRNTSLDELPQFLNVLKGDMTIVGPRPHPIAFHKTYATFINNIDQRLFVKPGITGLAQVKGYRGDVKDFEENRYRTKKRIALDLFYIRNWSIKTDLWIVYITFLQTIRMRS